MAPDVDITKFRFGWAPQLNQYSTPVQFQEAYEIEEALDQAAAAQNVRLQSYASTGVALVVSLLVIFCTLSMGVTERVRQYAVLRAIALTRAEIGLLIAIEGIVLAVVGLAGGVIAGWALLYASAAAVRICCTTVPPSGRRACGWPWSPHWAEVCWPRSFPPGGRRVSGRLTRWRRDLTSREGRASAGLSFSRDWH